MEKEHILNKLKKYSLNSEAQETFVSLVGDFEKGTTTINIGKIFSEMQKNQELAKGMTAFAAHTYLISDVSVNHITRSYLGLYALNYMGIYRDDKEFISLLHECCPDLSTVMQEVMQNAFGAIDRGTKKEKLIPFKEVSIKNAKKPWWKFWK